MSSSTCAMHHAHAETKTHMHASDCRQEKRGVLRNAWLLSDNGAFDFVPPRTQDLCVIRLTASRKLAPIP